MTERESAYKILHIHPLEAWPKYRACMEFSDKLILPYSLLLTIRRSHQPLPPLFQVSMPKSKEVLLVASVLHFSSEEHHGYFPAWMLRKLNFGRSGKDEVILDLLQVNKSNLYPYPHLKRIEIYIDGVTDAEACKKALSAYTVLTKGEWIKIMIDEKVYKVYLLAVFPKNKCIVRDFHFELCIKNFIPKVFIKEDFNIMTKRNQRVMSLERTKARFYEGVKSRGLGSVQISSPLQFPNPNMCNGENSYGLRYTAYNWSKNIPPVIQKEISTQANEAVEILPWDQEEHGGRGLLSQTPPMPQLPQFNRNNFRNLIKLNTLK